VRLLFAAALLVGSNAVAQPRPLAIVNGHVIDMRQEQPYRATLLIRGGRLLRVAKPNEAIPAGFETLDASGMWIIPGLFDMHAHIWDRVLLFPINLAYGITSVRDMGSTVTRWVGWRDSVSRGLLDGPRGWFSGIILDGIAPFSTFFIHVATPDSARAAVRNLKQRGATFIKAYDRLSRDSYLAIAEEARALRIPIAGHLPPGVPLRDAISAGQRSIEHLGGLSLSCAANGDSLRHASVTALDSVRGLDFARDSTLRPRMLQSLGIFYRNSHETALDNCDPERGMQSVARMLRESDTWLTPTFVLGGTALLGDMQAEDSVRAIVPSWVAGMSRLSPPADTTLARARLDRRLGMLRELRRGGVRLLIGSDAPNPGSVPGIGLHREIELFVKAGFTPFEALRIATRDAAEFLGASDSLGTIAPGQLADLVLLGADPLTDIRNTRRIRAVILQGRVLSRETLGGRLPRRAPPAG
jgi:hypothetical protein